MHCPWTGGSACRGLEGGPESFIQPEWELNKLLLWPHVACRLGDESRDQKCLAASIMLELSRALEDFAADSAATSQERSLQEA